MEPYKLHLKSKISDKTLSDLVFISIDIETPQRVSIEGYSCYVSIPLYFKTKKSLFSGYYHFGDRNFYSDTLVHRSGYSKRIESVIEWCYQ